MLVTKLEPLGKDRSKVFLNEELAFVLYRGELSRYRIKEGVELPEADYREILDVLLVKRARLRCMNLLKTRDQTEWQLRTKLKQGEYPQEIIDNALDYVKSYGYVNDASYAARYIEFRQSSRSRQVIQQELLQKGIAKDVIQQAFEESEPADETEMIRKWLEKKHFDPEKADASEHRKMYQFLARKGFSLSDICHVMKETEL